jgi:predicted Zn-dependent protease
MSFRSLSAEEREAITETRIRLFSGRNGEAIEALLQRSGSRWSIEEFAIANGMAVTDRFHEGQIVKVAVAEVYTSRR